MLDHEGLKAAFLTRTPFFGGLDDGSLGRVIAMLRATEHAPGAYVFREGDPAGWVHARLESDGIRLELRCIDQGHKAHGEVVKLRWRA